MDKETMQKFHNAFNWLANHPALVVPEHANLEAFPTNLSIDVVMVNPKTDRIDDNESFNTDVRIWLEFGPISVPDPDELELYEDPMFLIHHHDLDCDCGGPTFEEAVIELAELVKKKYGTYTPDCFTPLNHKEYCTGERVAFPNIPR